MFSAEERLSLASFVCAAACSVLLVLGAVVGRMDDPAVFTRTEAFLEPALTGLVFLVLLLPVAGLLAAVLARFRRESTSAILAGMIPNSLLLLLLFLYATMSAGPS